MYLRSIIFLLNILLLSNATLKAQYVFTEIDINPGSGSSNPTNFTEYKGKIIFVADNGTNGPEPWISDGTPTGTMMLKDICSGSMGSNAQNFIEYKGSIFFTAFDVANSHELWITDGTSAGTKLFKDINPGKGSSSPSGFEIANGLLFFSAGDSLHHTELWVSDGTVSGTQMVKDIKPGVANGQPMNITAFNGKVYFTADDGTNNRQLWMSDGTSSGTQMVKLISAVSSSCVGPILGDTSFIYNGNMFFIADDVPGNIEMWYTDGTAPGTQMLKDICAGGSSSPLYVTKYNSKLYFTAKGNATTPFDNELYVTDGTTAGTQLLKDIWTGTGSSTPFGFVAYNSKLYFFANDSVNGNQLWISDGTNAGTMQLKQLKAGGSNKTLASEYTIQYAYKFFFVANTDLTTAPSQNCLFVSDGTNAGTTPLYPSWISPTSTTFTHISSRMTSFKSGIYSCSNYNSDGNELWILRDTTYKPESIPNYSSFAHSFSMYPNPANGIVSVVFQDNYTNATLSVIDMTGRIVYTQAINSTSSSLNLSALAKGTYCVRLKNVTGTETQKLVLE